MNKFKKIVSAGIATALTLTSLPTVVFAEDEFLSVTELISATVEMAANNVQSDTYSDSLTAVEAKVTTSGDEVFYDGNSIGFWFSDTPNIIYKDAEKTAVALKTDTTTGGYTADPTLLCGIMTDFNNGLVSTYVPTTTDWSKIVGKYDITLGDITIPAENWLSIPINDKSSTPSIVNSDDYAFALNFTQEAGLESLQEYSGFVWAENACPVIPYIISTDGKLFVSDLAMNLYANSTKWGVTALNTSGGSSAVMDFSTSTGYALLSAGYSDLYLSLCKESDTVQFCMFLTNPNLTKYTFAKSLTMGTGYYNICSPIEKFDGDLTNVATSGVFYKKGLLKARSSTEASEVFASFWNSQSSSKLTIGNTTLEQRLAKLISLAPTDTITVSETGWTVNGIDNLDTYIGKQSVIEPGTGTDVSAVADIEAACFDVVIPTNLPIYVDDHGQVTVADNASIKNKNSLAVRITDIYIKAKPDTGWTLVDSSPSQARDAKEFTFTTSLTTGTELDVDETLTFSYDAKISPTTEGYTSLDLATVTVVVDWAD